MEISSRVLGVSLVLGLLFLVIYLTLQLIKLHNRDSSIALELTRNLLSALLVSAIFLLVIFITKKPADKDLFSGVYLLPIPWIILYLWSINIPLQIEKDKIGDMARLFSLFGFGMMVANLIEPNPPAFIISITWIMTAIILLAIYCDSKYLRGLLFGKSLD